MDPEAVGPLQREVGLCRHALCCLQLHLLAVRACLLGCSVLAGVPVYRLHELRHRFPLHGRHHTQLQNHLSKFTNGRRGQYYQRHKNQVPERYVHHRCTRHCSHLRAVLLLFRQYWLASPAVCNAETCKSTASLEGHYLHEYHWWCQTYSLACENILLFDTVYPRGCLSLVFDCQGRWEVEAWPDQTIRRKWKEPLSQLWTTRAAFNHSLHISFGTLRQWHLSTNPDLVLG